MDLYLGKTGVAQFGIKLHVNIYASQNEASKYQFKYETVCSFKIENAQEANLNVCTYIL